MSIRVGTICLMLLVGSAFGEQAMAYKPNLAANIKTARDCGGKILPGNTVPCFGIIVDQCIAEFDNPAVIPRECWGAENAAWAALLDETYEKLLKEIGPDKAANKATLREAQQVWEKLRTIDCKLEKLSNPRTYEGVLESACFADATAKRYYALQEYLGADWSEE